MRASDVVLRRQRQDGPWDLLVIRSSLIGELQASERLSQRGIV